MKPTDILRHEHQVILLVLDAVRKEARTIEQAGRVSEQRLTQMIEFFRNFVDRCHHVKEESFLFPAMIQRGQPGDRGPIVVLLREHDDGRRFVTTLANVLPAAVTEEPKAVELLRETLESCADLLESHIEKEDNILYPMADEILTREQQQALARAFVQVEAEELGPGTHEKYHHLAHELAQH